MNSTICKHCRMALRRAAPARALSSTPSRPNSASPTQPLDVKALLSKPTWSGRSLLPPADTAATEKITSKTLNHLLRLSALPAPSTPEEEQRMLDTLSSQLHFVRVVQRVDTSGVQPLRAIRDETVAGWREQTIGLEVLKDALAKEDVVGHARRPRRRRGEKIDARDVEDWDVLGGAELTAGRYFVVRNGKAKDASNLNSETNALHS